MRPTPDILFASALRDARGKAGISQEELAFRADVHRTYVSLLERGKKSPSLGVIFRLAHALDVSAARIIADIEKRIA